MLERFRWQRIAQLLGRPLRSLASRIVISVFSAALVTGLAVTWVSARSTEGFLREKIDQKFPEVLRGASERLDLWYSQRELDVATFARSATVVDSLRSLTRGRGPADDELARYLGYVLEQFPQYDALLVLDLKGGVLMQVGAAVELAEAHRARLSSVGSARLEPLYRSDGRRLQLVSARISDATGAQFATLHALLRVSAIEATLASDELGAEGRIYVVSGGGEVVLSSPGAPQRERYDRELVADGELPQVEEYADGVGAHTVGASVAFPRFGWNLVIEEPYAVAFAPVVAVSRQLLFINLGIIIVFGLIAYQTARSITRPIVALSNGALRIADGEVDVVIEGDASGDELGVMVLAFNAMAARLRENQTELEGSRLQVENANAQLIVQNRELQRVNEVFQQLSITDELTKLHNHRYFQDQLPREIKRAQRSGEPLCLILIDIDDFKLLNDRYGHSVGDAVLRKVAAVMNQTVRDVDLLARYGGEEFVLLAPRTDLDGAVVLAEKIRAAIRAASFNVMDAEGPNEIHVTASFGVALYRGEDKALFNDADRALYSAKANGKDCVVVADAA